MSAIKLIALFIALAVNSACVLQGKGTRKGTPSASNSRLQIVVQPDTLGVPTLIEYVELLDYNRWLIADLHNVWRTEDAGKTWMQTYSVGAEASEGQHIGGLSFIDMQVGFLIVNERLLRTDDGGKQWIEVSTISPPEKSFFENCYFIDLLHGWAVGLVWQEDFMTDSKTPHYIGAVFATQDGGQTWQRQRLEMPAGYFSEGTRWSLRDVFFRDAKTGWTVGEGVIFWTIDGGENWHVADAVKGQYKHVRFLNNHFGWATEREEAEFSITTDGGRHWKLLDGPPSYGSWSTTAVFLTPKYGFATLLSLYETKDSGRSWERISGSSEIRKPAYDYIGRARDGTLVALGLNAETVVSLVSSDNGATWQSNDQVSNKQGTGLAKSNLPLSSTIRKSEAELLKSALHRVKPLYPAIANAARASGEVTVEIVVDEEGNVISARALSGHSLLRDTAVTAARDWKFTVTEHNGVPVKIVGTLAFNFQRPSTGRLNK